MKKQLTAVILSLSVLISAPAAYCHSGRTDSAGGHRDNKNASGLGSYHYHCGGYPAHLHPNGVCPYKTSSGSKSTSSTQKSASASASATQPKQEAPCLKTGAIRTFINGFEIPTFTHSKSGGAYILAEDLKDYGFDVDWSAASNTVTVTKNNDKALTAIDMSYYQKLARGTKICEINPSGTTKVLLKNEAGSSGYQPACLNCNGYTAISIDELKAFTDNWGWNGSAMTLWLYTR